VVGLNLLLATLKMHNTFANAYALVARCRKINHESTGTKQKNTAFKRLKFISYFKVFFKNTVCNRHPHVNGHKMHKKAKNNDVTRRLVRKFGCSRVNCMKVKLTDMSTIIGN